MKNYIKDQVKFHQVRVRTIGSARISTSLGFSVPSVKSVSTSLSLSVLSKFFSTFLTLSVPSVKTSVIF